MPGRDDRPGAHRDPRRTSHPVGTPIRGEEVGYIVAGNVQMDIRDRLPLVLPAGDGSCVPAGKPRNNALDLGPDTDVMLFTYLVEEGQPLSSVAAGPS